MVLLFGSLLLALSTGLFLLSLLHSRGRVSAHRQEMLQKNREISAAMDRTESIRSELESSFKKRESELIRKKDEVQVMLQLYLDEARDAVSAFAKSEERLELVTVGARVGIWDTDCMTMEVFWSPRFVSMLGYGEGEIEGDFGFFDLSLHDEDRERVLENLQAHMLDGGKHFDVEGRLQQKSGEHRWYRITGQAQWGEDGRPLRLAGGITDIEEKKQFQQEIIKTKEAAIAAAEARSEFLANMSHEIRTPMTAILGFTDLLEDSELTPEERKDHVCTIRRNGEHLLSLINDILDISKLEACKMSVETLDCSPAELVGEVIQLMQIRAQGAGVSLLSEIAGDIPVSIKSDPTRIRQILTNLVGNALKFTEEGEVKIRIICAGSPGEDHVLRFEVQDTGIGIPPDRVDSLFEEFTQADSSTTRRFGGTGLGLSICKRLSGLLGGDILATSVVGKGSCFTFSLRLEGMGELSFVNNLCDAVRSVAEAAAQQRGPQGKKKFLEGCRVLLAEDGPDNQRLICFQLKKIGAQVEVAENGLIAYNRVREAKAEGETYDIILMDMQMPEMDGYTATGKLRSEGYEGPIIALTANAMSGDREKCLAAGCDDFATKPLVRKDFHETLRRYFSG